jgi:glycerate dehydrogenase
MRIVVLDGYALNPGDLSWSQLEALGPCTIYDRTRPEETVARAADAEIVLTNKTVLSREIIEQLPRLRYIGVLATGYNIVDTAAARRRRIPVTTVPDYATLSVVQMVFAHLLNLTLHVAEHGQGVAEGRWTRNIDFAYWDFPLVELAGLTLGVIGFGRIGRATAKVALALGMKVLAHAPHRAAGGQTFLSASPSSASPSSGAEDVGGFGIETGADKADRAYPATDKNVCPPEQPSPEGVSFVDLDELFRQSDAVSLHCPLTPETQKLVNARLLVLMKPSAYLINTGRGPLVDEAALAEALNAGRLAGAGLDVLSVEPPPADNPLLTAKNCCITPHIAWATRAARQRLLDTAVSNVRAFLTE